MKPVDVVVLTTGERPGPLQAAVASARSQEGVEPRVVLVGNGTDPGPMDEGVTVRVLPDNIGVAAGRNLGAAVGSAEVVCFLDDDARYGSPEVLAAVLARFEADPRLAVVSFRVAGEDGRVMRQHVPMLRKGRWDRVVETTTFLGGASAVRRAAMTEVAGFPVEFFYGLEETDLAWRLLDAGWRVVYAGDLVVIHPRVPVARRTGAVFNTARSRVLLVRRLLPLPLALLHLPIRFVLALSDLRSWSDFRELWRGHVSGFRAAIVRRRPLRWSTVWRMTRLGRPPVV